MASRTGLIAKFRQPVEPIPEPNRHIPTISADCRIYFPPNATRAEIVYTLTRAYTDLLHQIREHHPDDRENVWLQPPEGWTP